MNRRIFFIYMAMTLLGCISSQAQSLWLSPTQPEGVYFCSPLGSWVYPLKAAVDAPQLPMPQPALDSLLLEGVSDDSELGVVVGSGRYPEGSKVQLCAVPAKDVYFVGWSDENFDNPRILTLDRAMLLTAYFKRCSSADDENVMEELGSEINVRGHRVYVRGAAGYRLSIYDEHGRTVLSERRADDREIGYYVEEPGTYFVQIGVATAKKIVIK